jgi:hypothetical protein
MKFLIIIYSIITLCIFTALAYSHESHGYYHMNGPSGFLISMRWCPSQTQVWFGDANEDNIVDNCRQAAFVHNKFHIKNLPLRHKDETPTCICEERDTERYK